MQNQVPSQLLLDVGIMLNYTADEMSEDKNLSDRITLIIEDGREHLRSWAPDLTDNDFTKAGRARKLLFDYCRYAHSDATEMFNNNYRDELMALRFAYEVRAENEDQNAD